METRKVKKSLFYQKHERDQTEKTWQLKRTIVKRFAYRKADKKIDYEKKKKIFYIWVKVSK